MSEQFVRRGGRILSNFATLGAVATITFTVPGGVKWTFINCYAERDVNATFDMEIQDADGNTIYTITQVAAGVTNLQIPTDLVDADDVEFLSRRHLILGADWSIIFTWGVAQATPEVHLWVIED